MSRTSNQVKKALEDGNIDRVKYLLKTGHDTTLDNLLHDCLTYELRTLGPGHVLGAIELLLQHGAPINSLDEYGESVFHSAIKEGTYEVVKYLFERSERGADANYIPFTNMQIPPNLLDICSHPKVLDYLLTNMNLDVNQMDANGSTPLHRSVRMPHGHVKAFGIASLLIRHGALLDVVDRDGNTLMHLAALGQYPAVLRLLFNNGASMSIRNNEGKLASECVPLYPSNMFHPSHHLYAVSSLPKLKTLARTKELFASEIDRRDRVEAFAMLRHD